MKNGFSIIELMIAMSILIIVMSGVVVTSFGNQSFLIGAQTNAEAMIKAQEMLEAEQALARKDFNLVNATSSSDGFYTSNVQVTNAPGISPHPFDYLTKAVKAIVSWKDERGINRNLTLNTLIANFTGTASTGTCNSSPEGNWASPSTHTDNLTGLVPGISYVGSMYPITAIDAYQDKLYVGAGPTTGFSDKTFFVFNLTSGVPSYINGSAIDTSGTQSSKGPNALVVASSSAWGNKTYAFLANGASPDWNTCSLSTRCAQFQIIDITNPATPGTIINFKFATSSQSIPNIGPPFVNGDGASNQAIGKSIYYKNGYIFLGLTNTGSGPEFHIIDVHNPLAPQSVGSFPVGNTVNAIYVSGHFAYLATDDAANVLTILDISDPTKPQPKWSGVIPSSVGKGRSLTGVGDTLYFGKDADPNTVEFYSLDNPSPSTMAPIFTLRPPDLSPHGINAIIIRDYLAYLLTSGTSLQMRNLRTGTQTNIILPGNGSAMDCEGNYVYAGSSDAGGGITEVTGS